LTLSEKTRKKLVFGVLILTLVWAYFNFAGPGKDEARQPHRDNHSAAKAEPPAGARAISSRIADSLYLTRDAQPWGKNPFYNEYRLITEAGREFSDEIKLHLLGVIFRELKAQALINSQIVTVGEEIEGFRVDEIYRDSVILDNGEKTITLRVAKESS
jgi:hypothetical protein